MIVHQDTVVRLSLNSRILSAIDSNQDTREENSLKPTKMCSLKNRLWLLRPTPKVTKRDGVRKIATNVINYPHKLKGNAERERI